MDYIGLLLRKHRLYRLITIKLKYINIVYIKLINEHVNILCTVYNVYIEYRQ